MDDPKVQSRYESVTCILLELKIQLESEIADHMKQLQDLTNKLLDLTKKHEAVEKGLLGLDPNGG